MVLSGFPPLLNISRLYYVKMKRPLVTFLRTAPLSFSTISSCDIEYYLLSLGQSLWCQFICNFSPFSHNSSPQEIVVGLVTPPVFTTQKGGGISLMLSTTKWRGLCINVFMLALYTRYTFTFYNPNL